MRDINEYININEGKDEDLSKPKSLNKCKYIMISVSARDVTSKPFVYFLNDEEDIQTVYNFWDYSKKVVSKIIGNVMALSPGESYIHKTNNYDYEIFSCIK
jgi:hypothetical protein